MHDPIKSLADRLMRAVVGAGVVRPQDIDVALRVMREELKLFLVGEKYADERELAHSPAGSSLAFASLSAECARRVVTERAL